MGQSSVASSILLSQPFEYGCHLILHFCCAVSCLLSSSFCLIFSSLEISQTSHHLSSSFNLSLHSCLFAPYYDHHPLLQFSALFINGYDVTPYFSSNCFSSAFCSFCFRTAALVIIPMVFSGSPTPEFF